MEHKPELSQPFHPSDIINRYLLDKNPDDTVAITHDDDWMYMMKKGLRHEDLLHEDRLGAFLTQYCTMKRENGRSVRLVISHTFGNIQDRLDSDGTTDSISSTADQHDPSPELEMSDPSASEFEVSLSSSPESEISTSTTPEFEVSALPTSDLESSPPSTPSLDNPQIVITRMCPFAPTAFDKSDDHLAGIRAQNIAIGRKRIPVGLHVLVRFGGAEQRTQSIPIPLNDSDIEWDGVIFL
ncbi:hypothetical protein EV363DRAFT_1176104 [Boletus edulis]|nr:hypothetical protein EV363DRAFT_1176104 [Boletus edulis]